MELDLKKKEKKKTLYLDHECACLIDACSTLLIGAGLGEELSL